MNAVSLDLVERVRTHCADVMSRAELVTIDDERLAALAAELPLAALATEHPLVRESPADPTLIFALDAINFGSGYHDIVRKRPGLSGARTMAAALTHYVDWTGPLTATRLQAFTANDCSQIFGQELDGGALSEMMSLFAIALRDLGYWLESRGGALGAIDEADRSAVSLAEALTEMPFYQDDGFYKRAQITAADLARDTNVEFDDLDRLTAFADNLVPHTLRVLKALAYEPSLASTIERGELLEPNGQAEIEIRAAGVVAVERLASSTGTAPMDVDLALWTMGGEPRFKAIPRHRCRCVFY